MNYKSSIPFTGDAGVALDVAKSVFINNGYTVEFPSDTEIVARGPGMTNTRQNPLLGVTQVRISVESFSIYLSSDLGGVRQMGRFILFFPLLLALLLMGIFAILKMPSSSLLIAGVSISPWVIIGPLLSRWIQNRTVAAVDTLLNNMKSAGDRKKKEGERKE
jgi:hypothetical protein